MTTNAQSGPNAEPAILGRLVELGRNCHLGKYRHFHAASRAKRLNDLLGVPVVGINIALGSVFFLMLSQDIPDVGKWAGGFMALTAALISGISTFFSFGKAFEGHRAIANKYLDLANRTGITIARFKDGFIDKVGLNAELDLLQERYREISEEAKAFTTTDRDFAVALESEQVRIANLDGRNRGSA